MPRRWKLFTIVGLISLIADQATKIWARNALPFIESNGRIYGKSVEIIPNYWDWRLSFNPGSAFGLFNDTSGARVFLSVIGVIAVGAMLWMLAKARDDQTRLAWALGLVAGGAIGNLIDRIAFGVVTDFIVWKYHDTEWPTFNIADVTLVIGVGLLFLDMSREAKLEKAAMEAEKQKQAAAGAGRKPAKKKKR
ncbi:MAG: signal peptidase II [Proteobacteria bacterium]|nr:signal peptidase II [Pseudomonadota bacterium]